MAILSGQMAVTTAGTEVRIAADQLVNGAVMIKALSANTGLVFVGEVNGVLTSANGFQLAASASVILNHITNLNQIWVDSAVNGEGVCWIALDW